MRFRDVVLQRAPVVGITCADLPAHLADSGFGGTNGVLVTGLKADASAMKSGLLVGDIIVSINGEVATSHEQVVACVNKAISADEEIRVTVLDSSRKVRLCVWRYAWIHVHVAKRIHVLVHGCPCERACAWCSLRGMPLS